MPHTRTRQAESRGLRLRGTDPALASPALGHAFAFPIIWSASINLCSYFSRRIPSWTSNQRSYRWFLVGFLPVCSLATIPPVMSSSLCPILTAEALLAFTFRISIEGWGAESALRDGTHAGSSMIDRQSQPDTGKQYGRIGGRTPNRCQPHYLLSALFLHYGVRFSHICSTSGGSNE